MKGKCLENIFMALELRKKFLKQNPKTQTKEEKWFNYSMLKLRCCVY